MPKALHLAAADQLERAAKCHRAAAETDDLADAKTAADHATEAQALSTAAYQASEKALSKSTSTLPIN